MQLGPEVSPWQVHVASCDSPSATLGVVYEKLKKAAAELVLWPRSKALPPPPVASASAPSDARVLPEGEVPSDVDLGQLSQSGAR